MNMQAIRRKVTYFVTSFLFVFSLLLSPISSQTVFATPDPILLTINSATLNGSSSVSVNAGATVTAALNVTISGSGSKWHCTKWKVGAGAYTVVASGNYGTGTVTGSFPIDAPATPGTYGVSFIAYSNNGCTDDPSGPFILSNALTVLDVTPPTVTITAPTASSKVNGSAIISFSSSETLLGTECSVDNSIWSACTSGVTTLSGVTGFNALSQGAMTLYVRGTDLSSNVGPVANVVLTKDTIAPTATVGYSPSTITNTDVTATATAGEVVTYTNNGGSNVYVFSSNGTFTFNFVDAAGNTGSVTADVNYIDKTAPVVTITAPATSSAVNGAATIGFTSSEMVNPECSINDSVWVACVPGTTTLSDLTGFGALPEGTFSLYLRDTDAAGNIGTNSRSLSKDTVSPTASVAYSTTALTNTDVTATATASESVTYTNNGGSNVYVFSANGTFTFNFVDAAGNTGSATATVTNIDKVGPTITITSPSTGAYANGSAIVGFTVDETTTNTCSVNDSDYVACTSGTIALADLTGFGALPEGTNKLYVRAIDLAGNASTKFSQFYKDTIAPTATVGYSPSTVTNTDVTATATANETVTYTNNGGSNVYVFSSNGTFTFNFVDAAGNTGSVTADVNYIDKTAPVVTINLPLLGGTVNGLAFIGFTATDAASVECSIDNSTWVACSSGVSRLQDLAGFGGLADGTRMLYVKATDAVGNAATASVEFMRDTVLPLVNAGADRSSTSTFTQTGTASDSGSGLKSVIWGMLSGPGTVVFGDASNLVTSVSANVAGTYTVLLTAVDNAGNTATDTFSLIWSVATTTPPATNTGTSTTPTTTAVQGTSTVRATPVTATAAATTVTPVPVTTAVKGADTPTRLLDATDKSATATVVVVDNGIDWGYWLKWLIPALMLLGFLWFILAKRRKDKEEKEQI